MAKSSSGLSNLAQNPPLQIVCSDLTEYGGSMRRSSMAKSSSGLSN